MANDTIFKGQYGQNMFDIALNTYGTIETLIKLLNDNGVDLNTPNIQLPFSFDSSLVNDANIYNFTTGKGYVFSTGNPYSNGGFSDGFSDGFDIKGA